MSTTLLERTNPLEQLRPPTGGRPGNARRMLAELDAEVTQIFSAIEPVGVPRVGFLRRLRPASRPDPRRMQYPVAWNLPRRPVRPRISVLSVPRPGPASPTEMPRSLTWLPMRRAAASDGNWRLWLNLWDRTIVTQRRLVRAMLEMALQKFRVQEMALAAKTTRTVNYFTRAVWEDYLSVFGAVEGTLGAHIIRELGQLEMLAS